MNIQLLELMFPFDQGVPSVCKTHIGDTICDTYLEKDRIREAISEDINLLSIVGYYDVFTEVIGLCSVERIEQIWHGVSIDETRQIYDYFSDKLNYIDRELHIHFDIDDKVTYEGYVESEYFRVSLTSPYNTNYTIHLVIEQIAHTE